MLVSGNTDLLHIANISLLRSMGSQICITGYSGLLVSWDTVLHIVHSSLVGLIASGFNIAGYSKLLVSGNMVLLDKPGIADISLLGRWD